MVYLNLFQPLGVDFPQFYEAVKLLFSNLNPYQHLLTSPGPFNYPPTAFLFLFWLNLFPYNLAGAIWNISSLLSFVISLWLLLKIAFPKINKFLLIYCFIGLLALFSLTFFPLKHNLASGQINNFILLFLVLSFYFSRPFFLAYALVIKLIPAVFIIYFFLRREVNYIFKVLMYVALLAIISVLLVPADLQKTYFTEVAQQAWPLSGKEIYYNQSLLAFHARTFKSPVVISSLFYILNSIIKILTIWRGRRVSKNSQLAAVSSLLLIVPPLVWQHHFVLSIIPLVLLFAKNKFVVIVSYLLLASNIREPNLIPASLNLVLSHQFLAMFLLWLTALWERYSWVVIIALIYVLSLTCRGFSC